MPVAKVCYVFDAEHTVTVVYRVFKALELELSHRLTALRGRIASFTTDLVEQERVLGCYASQVEYLQERCSFAIARTGAKLAYNAAMSIYHAGRIFDLFYLRDLRSPPPFALVTRAIDVRTNVGRSQSLTSFRSRRCALCCR